jgi:UDP-N-acetylmuramoylalanine--D-glutamate ligase
MTDSLYGKHVVVMGFARQGQALARWLPTIGARVTVTDMRSESVLADILPPYREAGVRFVLGEHPLSLLDDADLLCVSGGVPLTAPLVVAAMAQGIPAGNDAQLFLERCPAPVIGITGSAGKTTTTTLVGRMCEADGRVTYVGGNIGAVLLDVLPRIHPEDTVVMELSSFQLDLATTSPPFGAILNVTPNHLDRHGTMEAYSAAKARLIQFQTSDSVAILGKDDPGAANLQAMVRGRAVWFSARESVSDGAYLDAGEIVVSGVSSPNGETQVVVDRSEVLLRGAHNVLNVLAACAIAGAAGVGVEAMRTAIRGFRGVAHRMEIVRVLNGVTWINDSIATAPERVLAGVNSYDEPLVLLLGGRDKNLPWETLLSLAAEKAKAVVAFGEFGPSIERLLQARLSSGPAGRLALDQVRVAATLDDAVRYAAGMAANGDVVLMSPGGTSYDAYLDFEERGRHFCDLVNALS